MFPSMSLFLYAPLVQLYLLVLLPPLPAVYQASQILMGKEKFSRLILDIIRENNTSQFIQLLELASYLFSTDPFYPQTHARLYYIEVKDDNKYEEARKWAVQAIELDPKIII